MNNINLVGTVDGALKTDETQAGVFVLKTNRLSGATDSLLVAGINTDNICNGDRLNISGSVQTINGETGLIVFVNPAYVSNTTDLDFNSVNIRGFICKKNNLRKTPLGRIILDCILAVTRDSATDYIPCVFWGNNAILANTLEIGSEVEIFGRLQSRTYTKDDRLHTTYEVSISRFKEVTNV